MIEKYESMTIVRGIARFQRSTDPGVNDLAALFKMPASTFAVMCLMSCNAPSSGDTAIGRIQTDIRHGHERIVLEDYFGNGHFTDVCAISEGDQPASVLEGSGLEYPISVTDEKNREADSFASFENGFIVFNATDYIVFRQSISDFCCIAGHRCSGIDYPWNHICASVGV